MNKVLRENMTANFKAVIQDQKETIGIFKKVLTVQNAKVVYIAGKVTNLPYKEVFEKFQSRQLELEAMGYIVINPCIYINKDEDWDTAMKLCLNLLQFADYINLLYDWESSKGARLEALNAKALGIVELNF